MTHRMDVPITATDVISFRQSLLTGTVTILHNNIEIGELPWKGGRFTTNIAGIKVDIESKFLEEVLHYGKSVSVDITRITVLLDGKFHYQFDWRR